MPRRTSSGVVALSCARPDQADLTHTGHAGKPRGAPRLWQRRPVHRAEIAIAALALADVIFSVPRARPPLLARPDADANPPTSRRVACALCSCCRCCRACAAVCPPLRRRVAHGSRRARSATRLTRPGAPRTRRSVRLSLQRCFGAIRALTGCVSRVAADLRRRGPAVPISIEGPGVACMISTVLFRSPLRCRSSSCPSRRPRPSRSTRSVSLPLACPLTRAGRRLLPPDQRQLRARPCARCVGSFDRHSFVRGFAARPDRVHAAAGPLCCDALDVVGLEGRAVERACRSVSRAHS